MIYKCSKFCINETTYSLQQPEIIYNFKQETANF